MQIQNHHNSDAFKIKGVGDDSLKNMEYLLERAKQELDVYYDNKHQHVIKINGESKVIHTFSLKGHKRQLEAVMKQSSLSPPREEQKI